ncbi:MAG: YcaO-like family protein, partial [Halobacteriaceae archaeon]
MAVGIAGEGPAVTALEHAFSAANLQCDGVSIGELQEYEMGIVVGVVGSAGFERANSILFETDTPWCAIEIGGIGGCGIESISATISLFGPRQGCYECLQTRVKSTDTSNTGVSESPSTDIYYAGATAARLTIQFFNDSVETGTIIEIPYAEHTLHPVPHCNVCDNNSHQTLQIQHTDRSLDESIHLAELGVDDKVGIISVIGERESYPAPYYLAQLSETDSFSEQSAPKHAAGVAVDWDRAFMKGLGEAYERYCSGVYKTEKLTKTSITNVTNPIKPDEFVRPSDADEITVNEEILWTPGISLPSEMDVHLPAELVYFPPPEERIRPAITTGLGLGNSTVEALLSGLYEIIERDAAMIAWYSTYEPLGLSIT